MPRTLSIAIVTHAPDEALLARTFASLTDAIAHAHDAGALSDAQVVVVDNGPDGAFERVKALVARHLLGREHVRTEILSGHGNVGFARANNLALTKCAGEFHLILNPDVEMHRDALAEAVAYLVAHPEVGALTPSARNPDGTRQYIVRSYPSVGVLLLRAFAPDFLRRIFRAPMERYEMREVDWEREQVPVQIVGGAFILCRRSVLDAVNGFDPGYFLYFEDYDLSLRLSKVAPIAYVPRVRIVHHGGHAASKGIAHIAWLARSAWRFFSTHGWVRR
jgi:GT2 family glycosyltransferase